MNARRLEFASHCYTVDKAQHHIDGQGERKELAMVKFLYVGGTERRNRSLTFHAYRRRSQKIIAQNCTSIRNTLTYAPGPAACRSSPQKQRAARTPARDMGPPIWHDHSCWTPPCGQCNMHSASVMDERNGQIWIDFTPKLGTSNYVGDSGSPISSQPGPTGASTSQPSVSRAIPPDQP